MLWWTIQQLKSKSLPTRLQAAQKLADEPDAQAIDALAEALADAAPEVRRAVAQALGQAGDARAFEPLARALRDADAETRQAAADALKALGDPRAVAVLTAALQDDDASVRWHVVHALETLGWQPADDKAAALQAVARGEFAKAAEFGPAAIEPLVAALHSRAYNKHGRA